MNCITAQNQLKVDILVCVVAVVDADKLVFANHRRCKRNEIKYEGQLKCIRFVAIITAAVMPDSMRATMVAAHIKKPSRRMKRFLKHMTI